METKNILVVEDRPEYRQIAQETFERPIQIKDNPVRFNATYATNADEGLKRIEENYDGVITDLFMPGTPDYRQTLVERLQNTLLDMQIPGQEKRIKTLADLILNKTFSSTVDGNKKVASNSWCDPVVYSLATLDDENPETIIGVKRADAAYGLVHVANQVYNLAKLDENPSGLAIAEAYINKGVAVAMLSQGDRHIGNMNIVRNAVNNDKVLTQLAEKKYDPLPNLLANAGLGPLDKATPIAWQLGAKVLYERLGQSPKNYTHDTSLFDALF